MKKLLLFLVTASLLLAQIQQPSSSGGGSPASPDCSVQYNNSGSFGGNAAFCWDNADLLLKIGGSPITPFPGLYVGGTSGALIEGSGAGIYAEDAAALLALGADSNPWHIDLYRTDLIDPHHIYVWNNSTDDVGNAELTFGIADNISYRFHESGILMVKEDNPTVWGMISFDGNDKFALSTASDPTMPSPALTWDKDGAIVIPSPGVGTNFAALTIGNVTGATNNWAINAGLGNIEFDVLKTTGAATGKNVVCVDTATGILYASSSGATCLN